MSLPLRPLFFACSALIASFSLSASTSHPGTAQGDNAPPAQVSARESSEDCFTVGRRTKREAC